MRSAGVLHTFSEASYFRDPMPPPQVVDKIPLLKAVVIYGGEPKTFAPLARKDGSKVRARDGVFGGKELVAQRPRLPKIPRE